MLMLSYAEKSMGNDIFIDEIRKSQLLTIINFCEKYGISKVTYHRIKNGKKKLTKLEYLGLKYIKKEMENEA